MAETRWTPVEVEADKIFFFLKFDLSLHLEGVCQRNGILCWVGGGGGLPVFL